MKKLIFLLSIISFSVKAQIPIEIPVPVKVVNAYSADWKRGPWATTTAAKSAIPQSIRVGGLTVWINACSCEYHWLDTDLSDAGLVPVAVPGWNLSGTTNLTGSATIAASTNDFVLSQSVGSGHGNTIEFGVKGLSGSPGVHFNSHNSSMASDIYLDESAGITMKTTGSAVIALDASGSSSQNIIINGIVKLSSTFITNDNTKTKVLVMDGTGGNERIYYNNKFINNPMTTQYDLVVGGSSGTPTRLGKGADNTFLSVQGGVLSYYSMVDGNGTTAGVKTFDWGGLLSNDVSVDDGTLGVHFVNIGSITPVGGYNVTTIDPGASTSSDNGSIVMNMGSTFALTAKDGTGSNQAYISMDSQSGFAYGGNGGFSATGRFGGGSSLAVVNDDIVMSAPGLGGVYFKIENSSQTAKFGNGPVQFSQGSTTSPSVIFPQTFPSPSSPADGWMWFDGNQLLFRRGSNSTTYDLLTAVKSINVSGGTTGLTFGGGPITTGGTITMAGTLAVANGGTGTSTPSLVAGTGVSISGSWPNQTITATGSGGITNSAANNEMMKSNGTNAVSSGITSSASGNMTMGLTSDGSSVHTLNVDGSSSDVSLYVKAKGNGIVNAITSQAFTVTDQSSTYQLLFYPGGASSDPKLQGGRGQTRTLTVIPMTGDASVNTGSDLKLLGSDAYSGATNANGGNVHIAGGAGIGTGIRGKVIFDQFASLGSGVMTLDNSGNSGFSSAYNLDLNNASIASSTITLDMNGQYQRMFIGSGTFATGKTMAVTNASNARVFDFHFEVTSTSATMTLPTGWLMSDANFASHVWTPPATGKYEMTATYDGNFWKVKIAGPFL